MYFEHVFSPVLEGPVQAKVVEEEEVDAYYSYCVYDSDIATSYGVGALLREIYIVGVGGLFNYGNGALFLIFTGKG
ncbi:hypothetical protein Lal_00042557 [Lupinus albus]|nr:hypothetical protein Lal_00042557 [Lupinus albus]